MLKNSIKVIIFFIISFSFVLPENINYDDVVKFNITLDITNYRSGEYIKFIYDVSVKERELRNNHKGCVIWLTGLSGSPAIFWTAVPCISL